MRENIQHKPTSRGWTRKQTLAELLEFFLAKKHKNRPCMIGKTGKKSLEKFIKSAL